jgi:hypothetical protein
VAHSGCLLGVLELPGAGWAAQQSSALLWRRESGGTSGGTTALGVLVCGALVLGVPVCGAPV